MVSTIARKKISKRLAGREREREGIEKKYTQLEEGYAAISMLARLILT